MIPVELGDRRGASVGDMLIFVATLSMAAALLYPAWSVRDFRASVESAIADVDALSEAARAVVRDDGRWPAAAPPGEAPAELSGLGGESGPFSRTDYTVGWTAWEVVDSVEARPAPDIAAPDDAPRETEDPRMEPIVRVVGGVTVRSGDTDLLAELMQRYGERSSFVLDTMWLLVLPERATPTRR